MHIIKIHEEGKEYACYTEALQEFDKLGIPMYVLSNSGFSAEALSIAIERLDG